MYVCRYVCNFIPGEYLRNFDIRLANTISKNGAKQDKDILCAHYAGTVGTGATERVNCTPPALGRYVTVALPSQRSGNVDGAPLSLCEVEIYGLKAIGR